MNNQNIYVGLGILAGSLVLLYFMDRGICNTLDAIALSILRFSRRLRNRRDTVQRKQQQMLLTEIGVNE